MGGAKRVTSPGGVGSRQTFWPMTASLPGEAGLGALPSCDMGEDEASQAPRRRSSTAASSGTPSNVTNDTRASKASGKKAAKATKSTERKAPAVPSDSDVPASATTPETKTPRP